MVRGKVSKCKNINLNGMDIFSRKKLWYIFVEEYGSSQRKKQIICTNANHELVKPMGDCFLVN